jgi:hypothetical protein
MSSLSAAVSKVSFDRSNDFSDLWVLSNSSHGPINENRFKPAWILVAGGGFEPATFGL